MRLSPINQSLDALLALLNQISDQDYVKHCEHLSGATIGEHTRHIIEMFQCLEQQYENGTVNYDDRKRDLNIQTNPNFAANEIAKLQGSFGRADKKLVLQQSVGGQMLSVETNYFRELLYNLEHCIHHQALIKVAVLQCGAIDLHEHFGVAWSTIEYRKQCAQ